jgi:hypothetical protein
MNMQKKFIIFLANKWKRKFKILNKKSMYLKLTIEEKSSLKGQKYPFRDNFGKLFGHDIIFNTLQNFISNFFKEISWIFYQKYFKHTDFDISRNSFHSNLIEENQKQIFIQFIQHNLIDNRNNCPVPLDQQQFNLKFIPAMKLDIRRGINLIIFLSKSLIIVQLKQETDFNQIMSHKKLKELSDNHFFYENNQKLTHGKMLSKGTHQIQFRTNLKGGTEERIFVLMSNSEQI